jgi:uroporphyrinogen-III decarboxylase
MNQLSSRENMLAAFNNEQINYTPCSFMLYKGLLENSNNYIDFLQKQIDLGLDAYAMVPPRNPKVINDIYNLHGMPVKFDPAVEVKEWIERRDNEIFPIMVKEYHTPAGTLKAEVRQTDDWRWGDHVPLFDDYINPRSLKYLISEPKDLDALRYLLKPPSSEVIENVRNESKAVIEFAHKHNLLTIGGWGVGADMLGWIYGFENMVYAVFDQPKLLKEILQLISDWNQTRMKALLEIGVDIYVKRAWYETCNFWSPKSFKEFLLPIINQEVAVAHQYNTKFGYIATDKVSPLLPILGESGIDVLIGIDPHTYDLNETKKALKGKVCMWGGVNGHLTIEMGSEEQTRTEVQNAMREMSSGGGFILSPVDNVREDTDQSRMNVAALIDEWKKLNNNK